MKDLKKMRERYLKDAVPVRLGNIASEILRLSGWLMDARMDSAAIKQVRIIAWLLEWSGDTGRPELADMQRELCRWLRTGFPKDERMPYALRAREMSEQILNLSGLLGTAEPFRQ
jgi:hypothetical protein